MKIVSYQFNSKSFGNKTGVQRKEIMEDRNIFIRYENLINDFDKILLKIKD